MHSDTVTSFQGSSTCTLHAGGSNMRGPMRLTASRDMSMPAGGGTGWHGAARAGPNQPRTVWWGAVRSSVTGNGRWGDMQCGCGNLIVRPGKNVRVLIIQVQMHEHTNMALGVRMCKKRRGKVMQGKGMQG